MVCLLSIFIFKALILIYMLSTIAIGSNNKLYKIMLLICNMHFVPVITIDVINKKDVVNIWMCCAAAPTVFWYHVYGSYRDELYNKDQMSLNDFLTLIIGLMLI